MVLKPLEFREECPNRRLGALSALNTKVNLHAISASLVLHDKEAHVLCLYNHYFESSLTMCKRAPFGGFRNAAPAAAAQYAHQLSRLRPQLNKPLQHVPPSRHPATKRHSSALWVCIGISLYSAENKKCPTYSS